MVRGFALAPILAICFLIAALQPSAAQRGDRGDWELLGQQKVGFLVDRDVIKVGRREGRFEAIQLEVEGNDVEILDLKVIYSNGQPDDIKVREKMRAGSRTRPLDLKGRDRAIKEIQIVYRSRPSFRGQATLKVYGRQADRRGRDADRDRRGKRDWERLGVQKVGFGRDTDVIKVGSREGKFKRIKLIVKDNDIEIRDLKVVYGNGQVDDLQVRSRIKAGSETRALDLKGDARVIKEIRMTYASRPSFKGQATVEVWGLED